ncbi:ABC transporter substrate-binding protein [Pigmentiphaga daeguensis]|uniref:ABC transporter substrate-binding protein n=1 Tax=Pigmentiphaga daeguensis TaxID=414049 RepID=A0ABN1BMQ2_9BURK
MLRPRSSMLRAAGALACCWALAGTGAQAAATPEEITVLTPAPPTLPGFAPWILAQVRGYYRDRGLKVNLMAANGGGVQVAKQVGAGIALAGSSVGDAPLFLRPNGIPIKVVAVLGGHSLMQVVVHDDDARIKTPADLRGKTVTVGSYTDSIYYSFLGMLKHYGVDKKAVNIQAAGPTGVWKLFATREADAMVATPDWALAAVNAGAKVRVFYGDQVFPGLPQAIVASDETIRTRPDLVEKVVGATLRAMREIMQDPAAAVDDFVAAVPAYQDKRDYVAQIIGAYARDVYPGQAVPGKMDPALLQRLQDFYVKEGLLARRAPLEDFYTDRFVGKAP